MIKFNNLSDQELVGFIKKGDHHAFNEIFERYNGILYIFARKLVNDQAEAEDLVQEVFISLWDKARTIELKNSLPSYLYSAVRYKFFDLVARKKIRSDYADAFQALIETSTYSTDDYINEKELIAIVEKEVANLPEKMREVFLLSRNMGLSHKEIALQLEISEKTVRNHVNHALKILRYKVGLAALFAFLISR